MPLRPVWISEPVGTWFCSRCGTKTLAVLNHEAPLDLFRRVHGTMVRIDVDRSKRSLQGIIDYLGSQTYRPQRTVEKRYSPRHAVTTECPVIPLDDQFRGAGKPFMVFARNLSTAGVGLLSTMRVKNQFLAVEFLAPGHAAVQIVVQARRCRPRGPFFDIGGEFVTKLVAEEP